MSEKKVRGRVFTEIVKECFYCANYLFDSDGPRCTITNKEIPNVNTIPSWCPLPEAKEEKLNGR